MIRAAASPIEEGESRQRYKRDAAKERRIIAHVRATMRPEDSADLVWTQPPKEDPVELVTDINLVPEKRGQEMCPCPICTPNAPQFYRGWLAFFPFEGVYRFIGLDCAKRYFGKEQIEAAQREHEAETRHNAAADFVFVNLGLVPAMVAVIDAALPAVEHVEDLRRALGKAPNVRTTLLAAVKAAGGELTLYRDKIVEVPHPTIPDRMITRREPEPVRFGPMRGSAFLNVDLSTSSTLRIHKERLKTIDCGSGEPAEAWVLANIDDREAMRVRRAAIEEAGAAYGEAVAAVAEALAFFAPGNLDVLKAWGASPLNTVTFIASHQGDSVGLSVGYTTQARIRVNRDLLQKKPKWPSLD